MIPDRAYWFDEWIGEGREQRVKLVSIGRVHKRRRPGGDLEYPLIPQTKGLKALFSSPNLSTSFSMHYCTQLNLILPLSIPQLHLPISLLNPFWGNLQFHSLACMKKMRNLVTTILFLGIIVPSQRIGNLQEASLAVGLNIGFLMCGSAGKPATRNNVNEEPLLSITRVVTNQTLESDPIITVCPL
ncbi:hypothetical protein Leryth_023015 [Lithospermum erythrorhizon]|nr:hypothetical protein Leryth_023015 [Lithospermum erythrorhizon]